MQKVVFLFRIHTLSNFIHNTNKFSMPFNKTILATVLLSIFSLSGCNSGGNDSTTDSVVSTKTITVIDGTLENAQICVDLNDNNQCDKSDKILPQLTDKAGKVEVSVDDAKHSLIAQIIAGQTKDSDEITPVTHSYSMITDANQSVITPFTTLAKVDPPALSEIEEILGLTKQELLGDLSTLPAACILARSITPVMTNDIVNVAHYKDTMTKIVSFILDAQNDDPTLSQLTNKRIIVSNGKAEAQPLIKNITDLLVGKTWFIASANSDENKDTDVGLLKFQDANHLEFTDSDGTESVIYTIDKDNNFVSTDSNNNIDTQKLVYVSSDLIISAMKAPDGTCDLFFWSTKNLKPKQSLPVTASQFVGKTWYMLDNSNNDTKELTVFGLTFNPNNSLTIIEQSESSEGFNTGSWSIKNNVLTTKITDDNTTYVNTNIVLAQTSDFIVIKGIETSDNSNDPRISFNVLFSDNVRPMSILKQLGSIQGDTSSSGEVTTHVNVANHKEIAELSIDKSPFNVENPDAHSLTMAIKNGQVTYYNSMFNDDGTYYVMGYNPNQAGNDFYAYGPLKVTVIGGRIKDKNLDFTHAPIFHAVAKD